MSDLRRTADGYLADLHHDSQTPAPLGVSEASSKWADAFLTAIRDFREAEVSGEAQRAARRFGLSSAKDKLRFFWEFWQNADDAGASTLRFVVGEDQLVVENDGNPFSSRDVYSVCFVASSQKAGDISKKGQFGIGFLSLMKVSEAPEVHSGAFHFRLERNYTNPGALPLDGYVDGTRVVAKLRHSVDSAALLSELASRIATEEEILLYMSTLRRVEVYDGSGTCVAHIETKAERSHAGAQVIYLGRQRWVQFRKDVEPPTDLEREDGEPIPPTISIVLARCNAAVGPHRVSAFFPTNVKHHLPWRFSAPFEVTTSREALLDSDYNRWLLTHVGIAMVEAAIDGAAGDKKAPWRLVPGLKDNEGELAPLVEAAHSRLKEVAWLPTRSGPMKPADVTIAASPELKRLIKPADVADDEASGRTWLTGEVNADDRDLLMEMGAYLVCCHELSGVLGKGPNNDVDWFLRAAAETVRLAKSLGYGTDTVYRALADGRCFKDRLGAPFSLSQARRDGKVVCNARSENLAEEFSRMTSRSLVLLHRVYRPLERKRRDQRDEDRDELDAWLRSESGNDARFKYEFRLDAPQFIRHFLASDSGATLHDLEQAGHDRLLSFLRDHIGSYQTAYPRDDGLSRVGQNLTVTASSHDGEGKRVYGRLSIDDVYLGRAFSAAPWAIAARGAPSIWWLADKYRKLLSREADGMSTVAFLRKLGAHEVPRVLPVAESASHGVYRFAPVSRGGYTEFPHFPHEAVGTRWYSAYGTRGDRTSPDIDRVLAFIEDLPAPARAERGQALLRTIEQAWQSLSSNITARALAYRNNGEYSLGVMPTRWIHSLRSMEWMRVRDGSFRAPFGLIAAIPETVETLGSKDRDLSAWESKNVAVAESLGMLTAVSATLITERFRTAKKAGATIPIPRLTAYYNALARVSADEVRDLIPMETEELIHTPGRGRNWWPPNLCYLTSQNSIFGASRAYLGQFREADTLWKNLGVRDTVNLDDLQSFWREVSGGTPSPQLLSQLDKSYFLANKLAVTIDIIENAPLWTNSGWKDSSQVVATDDEELWQALKDLGLPRWQQQRSQSLQQFTKYCGVVTLEQATSFDLPSDPGTPSLLDEAVLRSAAKAFAADAARLDSSTWKRVSAAIRKWARLKVVRIDALSLTASVSLRGLGDHSFRIQRHCLLTHDTLYLSSAASLEDPSVASALLSDPALIELSAVEHWNLGNALRVKFLEAALGIEHLDHEDDIPGFDEDLEDGADDFNDLFDDSESVDDDLPQPDGGSAGDDDRGAPESEGHPDGHQLKSEPEPCPVDDYDVISDVRGGKPGAPGRRRNDRKIKLRRPGPTEEGTQPKAGHLVRPPATIEARGLALYVKHVLEPEGIRVVDQRQRKGVGADILGDDRVFRELKTFSRRAPGQVSLTRHEAARAQAEAQAYELVIAEEVWGDATITIICDPLSVLDSFHTGRVVVTDWRQKLDIPETRVVTLQRPSEDSAEDRRQ